MIQSLTNGAALMLLVLISGCVTSTVREVDIIAPEVSQTHIPENQVLDVGIVLFDPGLPGEDEERDKDDGPVFPEIRKAEAHYVPVILKHTLQQTRQWGAVRVIPSLEAIVDVTVEGKIIHSDGETLTVSAKVTDATGDEWFHREYSGQSSKYAYSEFAPADLDPFQFVYNQIALDMSEARDKRNAIQLVNIRTVGQLRFGARLVPEQFAEFIGVSDAGITRVVRLPAAQDPMLGRVERIRDRDYLFIDTLDEHFENFAQSVDVPYHDWRRYSFEETVQLRELRQSARWRKIIGAAAAAGGVVAATSGSGSTGSAIAANTGLIAGSFLLRSGFRKSGESKIHAAAIRELGMSLDAEVTPYVAEIEGQRVTLTGSAEQQFMQWRNILKDLYLSETGIVELDSQPR